MILPAGRTSDSMTVPTSMNGLGPDVASVVGPHRDIPVGFLLLRYSDVYR